MEQAVAERIKDTVKRAQEMERDRLRMQKITEVLK
jgi:hypothetical protein